MVHSYSLEHVIHAPHPSPTAIVLTRRLLCCMRVRFDLDLDRLNLNVRHPELRGPRYSAY